MMYRIVYNEQTHCYRVESHGIIGWNFVSDPKTDDYLGFDDMNAARDWIKQHSETREDSSRRWKVVSVCS